MKSMFGNGTFRKGHFEELYKEYLYCPVSQHKTVTQNLDVEKALRGLDKRERFNGIKDFRDKLVRIGLDLRISQRPYVLSVGILNDLSRFIRLLQLSGKKCLLFLLIETPVQISATHSLICLASCPCTGPRR